jgi:hypothetical protein
MAITVAYNEPTQGWSSFFDYIPEFMVGLNNSFYSFKNGQIYVHNSLDVAPCNYYGVNNPAEITFLVNDNPLERKLFKSIALESSSAWTTTVITPDETGQNGAQITPSQYELKEGMYFSNLRYNGSYVSSPNFKNRSTIGIGVISAPVGGTTNTRTFTFGPNVNISSSISLGDILSYGAIVGVAAVPSISASGVITAISGNVITVGSAPNPAAGPNIGTTGWYVFVTKNAIAESYGLSGSYMEVTLQENTTNQSELFAVEVDYMKSFP